MDLEERIARLTDEEALLCLNGVLKGLTVSRPERAQLIGSTEDMLAVVEQASSEVGQPLGPSEALASDERPEVVRAILTAMAGDETLRPRVEGWLTAARPKLLEPVTGALVLAGIVMVLSTHVNVEFESRGGKRSIKVKIEKKPTVTKLLEQFYSYFK